MEGVVAAASQLGARAFGADTNAAVNVHARGFPSPPERSSPLERAWTLSRRASSAASQINFVGLDWRASVVPRAMQPVLNTIAIGFPAADTLSVFPLIAVTLGNSYDALGGAASASQSTDTGSSRRARARAIAWRLSAAVPPIVATLAVADLALTLQVWRSLHRPPPLPF